MTIDKSCTQNVTLVDRTFEVNDLYIFKYPNLILKLVY